MTRSKGQGEHQRIAEYVSYLDKVDPTEEIADTYYPAACASTLSSLATAATYLHLPGNLTKKNKTEEDSRIH